MNTTKRPLSPHLQIYKPQLTSVLSITHRLTGFGLSIVILLSPLLLFLLTNSKESHLMVISFLKNSFVKLILSLALFAILYHLFNGIRHLAWDAGYGLELKNSYMSGYAVLILSSVITFSLLLITGAF